MVLYWLGGAGRMSSYELRPLAISDQEPSDSFIGGPANMRFLGSRRKALLWFELHLIYSAYSFAASFWLWSHNGGRHDWQAQERIVVDEPAAGVR